MIHLLGSTTFLVGLLAFLIILFYVLGPIQGFFALICLLMIPLILIQKGKGNMGLGAVGSGAQAIFGGSGGQSLFQKITWGMGALFMGGSLLLSLYTTSIYKGSKFIRHMPSAQTQS